jgi:hypothetical protein
VKPFALTAHLKGAFKRFADYEERRHREMLTRVGSLALVTLLVAAPVALARTYEDVQAPRGEKIEDIQSLRGEKIEDIQTQRGEKIEDIQAPRGEKIEEIQAPRG